MSKLVRDLIPEINKHNGKGGTFSTYTEEAYKPALYRKIVEEAAEVMKAALETPDPVQRAEQILAELGDVYEVIDTILALESLNEEQVISAQAKKRVERGGFDQRIEYTPV